MKKKIMIIFVFLFAILSLLYVIFINFNNDINNVNNINDVHKFDVLINKSKLIADKQYLILKYEYNYNYSNVMDNLNPNEILFNLNCANKILFDINTKLINCQKPLYGFSEKFSDNLLGVGTIGYLIFENKVLLNKFLQDAKNISEVRAKKQNLSVSILNSTNAVSTYSIGQNLSDFLYIISSKKNNNLIEYNHLILLANNNILFYIIENNNQKHIDRKFFNSFNIESLDNTIIYYNLS